MDCDNSIHVPLFHLTKAGCLLFYLAFQNHEIPSRTIWILEESNEKEIKFKHFRNSLEGITSANIRKGIPLYLNVCWKGILHKYYYVPCDNCITTLTYTRINDGTEISSNQKVSHRYDYILFTSEKSNQLDKLGIFLNTSGGRKVYVWESPMKDIYEKNIRLNLAGDFFEDVESQLYSNNPPPLLIFHNSALYTFNLAQKLENTSNILYKNSRVKSFESPGDRHSAALALTFLSKKPPAKRFTQSYS